MIISKLSKGAILSLILFFGTSSGALAQIAGPPTILGDFKCYIPEPDFIGPPSVPVANLGLEDQFRTLKDVDVFDRELFCGHVTVNTDGSVPEFKPQHYWTYDIVVNDLFPDVCIKVLLDDIFGTSTHLVCEPDELWVPALKNHDGIIFPSLTDVHYLCYPLNDDSEEDQAFLVDQFTDEIVKVLEPTHLCNPVIKTVNSLGGIPDSGASFGELIDEHLKCYDIINNNPNPEPGTEKDSDAFLFVSGIDQFSSLTELDPPPFVDNFVSDRMDKLCVVTEKSIVIEDGFCDFFPDDPICTPVGGEFLSIDNTSLVLLGIQSSAIWMLPVLAGAVGSGAYYIKTRMNKE